MHVAGELVEDTYDWFAQDTDGNVWYLGEDSTSYEEDGTTSKEGSWEYGVDGALPGIVMLADPAPGDSYRQEYYPGEAEDLGEVLSIDETKTIALGEYTDVVVTEDWNPLDPETIENKYYAPGVGMIYSEHTAGPAEFEELVEFTPAADSAPLQPQSGTIVTTANGPILETSRKAHHEAQDQDRDRDDRARWRCGGWHGWLRRRRRR